MHFQEGILSFPCLKQNILAKDFYAKDDDFSSIFSEFHLGAYKDFYLFNQYLFKGKRLCIPQGFPKSITH